MLWYLRKRLHPKQKALLLLALCFLAGGGVGYALHGTPSITDPVWGPVRAPHGEYRMIQPLLACDFPDNDADERMRSLKTQFERDIERSQDSKKTISASVYLRSMNSGESLGINEEKRYDPASMFKVVLMMTYAHMAESHPDLFDRKLIMTDEIYHQGDAAGYYSSTTLVVGQSYRVGTLIDTMIVQSDNGAKDLLLSNITTDELVRTLQYFGLELARSSADNLKMSPKDISLFFRTLYSATYLDNLHSEVALELLSRTTFKDGIVAGLPYGTLTAHKYGEFINSEKSDALEQLELHDCGIVYAPGNPYFLCVMTEGGTHEELARLISTVSQHAYYEMTTDRD